MSGRDDHIERLHTGELELGITDALQKHIERRVVPAKPVSQRKLDFEHKRPRLLRECMAEATGVFFYVLPGCAAITAFTLAGYNEAAQTLGVPAFGGLMQIGFSFGFGIAFAIITCAATSGGHFNPAITISLWLWQGFPIRKVPLYIFSQIFGAFMAGMVLMGCYWPEIQAVKAINLEQHGTAVFNGGAASILCTFPNPNQTNQGYLFFQEFMVDAFIGVVIWSCLDPANPFVTPASVPWVIGNTFTWDDWFRVETEDDSLQPTIDMLLNVSVFMWYGAVAPWREFRVNDVIPLWRLIILGILILLLRRIPMVLLFHKKIKEIEDWPQALFVGFFGPIGVSAVFYLYVSLDFLNQILVDGAVREDAARLQIIMRVVIWFLAITSIVVHGLSVPIGKLGYRMPRTISQALSFDKQQSRDALQLNSMADPQSYLRRRRVEPREDQPNPPTFTLSAGNAHRQDGTPAPDRARESSADSRTLKSI